MLNMQERKETERFSMIGFLYFKEMLVLCQMEERKKEKRNREESP
jgi:hypothetical protein